MMSFRRIAVRMTPLLSDLDEGDIMPVMEAA
jgi:hypothetical protein